jgi:ribonuclease HII
VISNNKHRVLIGVDEVGRGPLAGPVCVCALALYRPLRRSEIIGLKDSKKLNKKQREEWRDKIINWKKAGRLDFKVTSASQTYIDKFGIQKSITNSLNKALKLLGSKPDLSFVRLDGGLCAPSEWLHQETIVRGDESEPAIALASIVAKVHRDKLMDNMSKMYPEYGFETNKGYGTRAHIDTILKIGPSAVHRVSYLKCLKKLDKSKNIHII